MYPKKYTGLAGRFIVVCFLLFSCIYNAGYPFANTTINANPLTERGAVPGENKPDAEEETRLVPEQQRCHSPVTTRQKQEHYLKVPVNGACQAEQTTMAASLAGPGILEKPYYYIFLFRHNLF